MPVYEVHTMNWEELRIQRERRALYMVVMWLGVCYVSSGLVSCVSDGCLACKWLYACIFPGRSWKGVLVLRCGGRGDGREGRARKIRY